MGNIVIAAGKGAEVVGDRTCLSPLATTNAAMHAVVATAARVVGFMKRAEMESPVAAHLAGQAREALKKVRIFSPTVNCSWIAAEGLHILTQYVFVLKHIEVIR